MVENNDNNDIDTGTDGDTEAQKGRGRRTGRTRIGRGRAKNAPDGTTPDAADSDGPQPVSSHPDDPEPESPQPEVSEPEGSEPQATEPDAGEQESDVTTDPDATEPGAPAGDEPTESSSDGPGEADENDSASEPEPPAAPAVRPTTSLIFQAPDLPTPSPRHFSAADDSDDDDTDRAERSSVRRRTRRRSGDDNRDVREQREAQRDTQEESPPNVVKVRQQQRKQPEPITEPQRIKGSTRLEAKKQRRRDGRDAGRRRPVITEAEFLARRESVDRVMVVRSKNGRIQIGVLEDGVLVEHYVARNQEASMIGNVYLGRVQNVLPSMEAAFVDIGRGRNAVLYSGEVDWDAANDGESKNQPRRIELALKPGDKVLVQVTKDPVGHKGARLTSQVSLPGRYLVYVPNGSMNGISRKLPDTERARLKKILKEVLPENVGVIVRTAAEGATEDQLTRDVTRLTNQWAEISRQVETVSAPAMLHSEPDLLVKIIRDVFNEDFQKLVIAGDDARETIEGYLRAVAPDLIDRVERYDGERDAFDEYRVSEQIEKALDRKVWLPSGGSLVLDRTEAMTVVDVNTGKFVGSGGNLEETVTKNNLEAAEEIVRQLRLRDIGGIIVVDFIDMVLESNRDLVLRRLVECLSRDRTKHQVAEVTSLGLVQMTRKKLGLGLLESFSEPCEACAGRGILVHHEPTSKHRGAAADSSRSGGRRGKGGSQPAQQPKSGNGGGNGTHAITDDVRNALAKIAKSTVSHVHDGAVELPQESTGEPAAASPLHEGAAPAEVRETTPATPAAESAQADAAAAGAPVVPDAAGPDAVDAAVAILDIPVARASRSPRKVRPEDAESILGSVLESLPEPKKPGQGRGRGSRRASSAGGSPATVANSE